MNEIFADLHRHLAPPKRPKATLVKSKEGFLVFRSAKGPRLSSELVKKLEAETA